MSPRSKATLLFLMATLFFLGSGCVREGRSQQNAPVPPKKQATRPVAEKKKLVLPQLKKPEPVAADKVVHLIYTSNVAGEAEPCG